MKTIPLEKIINFTGNRYELTNAVIKRAEQLAKIGDPDLEEFGYKVVSAADDQILSGKVLYRLQE